QRQPAPGPAPPRQIVLHGTDELAVPYLTEIRRIEQPDDAGPALAHEEPAVGDSKGSVGRDQVQISTRSGLPAVLRAVELQPFDDQWCGASQERRVGPDRLRGEAEDRPEPGSGPDRQ